MPRSHTLPLAHFEQLYAGRDDPWRYASSDYERGKYAATMAALPRQRYRSALDVGCSIGVLTAQLAGRCVDLLAVEPVAAALAAARRRNAGHPHVRFASCFVPEEWPDGRFDLILVSEVLDYIGGPEFPQMVERILGSLEPGGDLVLVHWVGKKGPSSNGEEAADRLMRAAGPALASLLATRNRDYRMDVLRRT